MLEAQMPIIPKMKTVILGGHGSYDVIGIEIEKFALNRKG
jgi:hypothetical protein